MPHHPTSPKTAKQLHRLATLLSALADLTERAGHRSGAVCWLVLWLIRPAETVACDYVDKIAPGAARMAVPLRPLDGAGEALRLAHGLRLLAATLAAFAEQAFALLAPAPASRWPAGPEASASALVSRSPKWQPCPP
ncbi:MAG: hypothetical protein ACXIVF_04390 [Rhizobiaceae bacterium]